MPPEVIKTKGGQVDFLASYRKKQDVREGQSRWTDSGHGYLAKAPQLSA